MENFETELAHLINRHSIENASNTPDFLLAEYLMACLKAFAVTTEKRDVWYDGRPRKPFYTLNIEEQFNENVS